MSVLSGIRPFRIRYSGILLLLALCASLAPAAFASTYYVRTDGSDSNNGLTNSTSGAWQTVNKAASAAAAGDTVIVEPGTYNVYDPSFNSSTYSGSNSSSYTGVVVANSGTSTSPITFESATWHGAVLDNGTTGDILEPYINSSNNPTSNFVTWQGFDFGSTNSTYFGTVSVIGWDGWQFLDDEFVDNGGALITVTGTSGVFTLPDGATFKHCLFSDNYENAVVLAGYGNFASPASNDWIEQVENMTVKNSIIRRANRANYQTGNDTGGNKTLWTDNTMIDGLVAYDNQGPAWWFDTDNSNWTVQNSTFFGNHGGPTWTVNGEAGTDYGDTGAGLDTEANPNGIIKNNYFYGGAGGSHGGAAINAFETGSGIGGPNTSNPRNLGTTSQNFAITGNSFFYTGYANDNWSGASIIFRGQFDSNQCRVIGPASASGNFFQLSNTSQQAFNSIPSEGNWYMPSAMSITFNNDTYAPDSGTTADWATWHYNDGLWSNTDTFYQATSLSTIQSTLGEESSGSTGSGTFIGSRITNYEWPASGDTTFADDYFPSNSFSLTNSIHQINDTTGATNDTIDGTGSGSGNLESHSVNDVFTIPVVAHMPITGSGPYSCEIYDLAGRWVSLTIPSGDLTTFENAVPPYVTCGSSNATAIENIQITLNSLPPYNVTATYTPSGGGGSGYLVGIDGSAATSYNVSNLGTTDWRIWGIGTGNGNFNVTTYKSGGGTISDKSTIGSGSFNSWNDSTRFDTSWSGGAVSPTSSSGESGYIYGDGVGSGLSFTVPAGTTTQTLYVLVGGDNSASDTLTATLSDGSATAYTNTDNYSGFGAKLYAITFHAGSANKTLTVKYVVASGSGNPCADFIAAWLTPGVSGSISGSDANAASSYTVSSGSSDWRVWGPGTGNGNLNTTDYKSGGGTISDKSTIGSGSFNSWNDSTRFDTSWSGGAVSPTSSSGESGYIYGDGVGSGLSFTVPAGTTTQTLYVLVGGDNSASDTLTATLSDGSATAYTNTDNYSGFGAKLYTLTFNAANANQTLTVKYVVGSGSSNPCADFIAAWL